MHTNEVLHSFIHSNKCKIICSFIHIRNARLCADTRSHENTKFAQFHDHKKMQISSVLRTQENSKLYAV